MKLRNEKGFTLVEILAALTILGIVFISFMTIFPQMSNMNERTETKLITMNLAKKELRELKNNPGKLSPDNLISNDTSNSTELYRYDLDESRQYKCEVIYYTVPDLERNIIKENQGADESVSLNKVEISVLKNGKLISETFGYLESSDE